MCTCTAGEVKGKPTDRSHENDCSILKIWTQGLDAIIYLSDICIICRYYKRDLLGCQVLSTKENKIFSCEWLHRKRTVRDRYI